jgi:glycogen operon protein
VRNLATRLTGSADLFGSADPLWDRGTAGSVNFITAHDGFTMADLVRFEHKHNEANGENNRDGTDDNRSWNHGVEGSMLDVGADGDGVVIVRLRSIRNMLAMLMLSAGVPMLTAGDELGRTQNGNNNAYCQDNEISWVDWELDEWQKNLMETSGYLARLRRENAVLRPTHFLTGAAHAPDELADVSWFNFGGTKVTVDEWNAAGFHSFQMLRSGYEYDGPDALIVINGYLDKLDFIVPPARGGEVFEKAWDSCWEKPSERDDPELAGEADPASVLSGQRIEMEPLSVRVYFGTAPFSAPE